MNRISLNVNWQYQKGNRKKNFPDMMDDEKEYLGEHGKEYRNTRVKLSYQKKNLRDFFQGSDK